MVAAPEAADAAGEADLEVSRDLVRDGPRPWAGRRPQPAWDQADVGHALASPAASMAGALTSVRTRSMTASGVMPSVSAA